MKRLLMAICALTLLAIPSIARAQSCGTVPTQLENKALDEAKASNWATAFSDFRTAKDQRRVCIRKTTGQDQDWNVFWGAFDESGMSKSTGDDKTKQFWRADAHKVCTMLLSYHLTGQIQTLVQQVWDDTR
jgi:hypothetical protein